MMVAGTEFGLFNMAIIRPGPTIGSSETGSVFRMTLRAYKGMLKAKVVK
jgi:hypothetical protein